MISSCTMTVFNTDMCAFKKTFVSYRQNISTTGTDVYITLAQKNIILHYGILVLQDMSWFLQHGPSYVL